MTQSGSGSPRRRRSWRRRQLRLIRLAWAAVGLLGLAFGSYLIFQRTHSVSQTPDLSISDPQPAPDFAKLAAEVRVPRAPKIHHYPIYNYSVVRGGVHSVEELRQAVAHDRQVAAHFAKFQYQHARLVRLQKPALVYLSYRMNDKIYWTQARHKLNPGEELLTDGTISARTKCANQVSTRKQLAVSPEEPPVALLEQLQPDPLLPPIEGRFPALYKAALLPNPAPSPVPSLGGIGIAGPYMGVPLPHGRKPACETEAQEKREEKLGIKDDESKEVHCPPRHHKPPAAVPEPGTILLMGSGIFAIYASYRKRKLTA